MKEIRISDPAALICALNGHSNGFVYRGQSDASWPLTSSLERILEPVWDQPGFDFKKFEDFTIKRFSGKFHLYSDFSVSPKSKLEEIALMQHYGAPTRLVDFTESPYLALYFAIESYNPLSKKDFSFYAIDATTLMKRSLEELRKFDNKFDLSLSTLEDQKDRIFDDVVDRFAHNLLWVSEPKIINRRLDLQSGTFLISINRGTKIEDAIRNPVYDGVDLIKYVVPAELYESVYVLLRKTNITSKSVYGDLEGLGRSVRMELVAYARPTV
jgi:hypothetical protein